MIEHLLNATCNLRSKSTTVSASGFQSVTATTGTTVYPCRVDVTSDESMEGGRESPVLRGQIYLPFGTPVTSNHNIVIASGTYSGRVFEVNGTPVDDVGNGTHLCCEVRSTLDGVR